ncbi:hypothetical protein [Patulibacter sp. SYSU D01012]|uniref:hypothetical protein n=1 Tax=Patulibacter sp. SYSU D01012 TaxID=2817381 RepID=UPI001B310C47|nr:hypothetical protein [Patulibacter sp. SYSU D01012]
MSGLAAEATRRTRTVAIVAASAAVLLLAVAAVCLLGLHAACTTAVPPPLDGAPAPGTPRAAYCAAADTPGTRGAVGVLCLLAAAATGLAWPRRRGLALLGPAVTAAVLLAGLLVAGELEAGVTV